MIKIENLHFAYRKESKSVLSGMNLSVKPQSLFGLLGPNGAGKTTVLSILSGLLPCPKNTVFVDGIDITTAPGDIKSTISLVPQEYAFYPELTVLENLRFFSGIQSIPAAQMRLQIDQVVRITSLQDNLHSRAKSLSGGLKRRLNLAIGLLNRPRLLFLDEPTVGIDPQSRRFILEAIKDINRQGTTVVYTTHYMEEVEYLCDDIAILDSGEVICHGSLQELMRAGVRQADGSETLKITLRTPLPPRQIINMQQHINITQAGNNLLIRLQNNSDIYSSLNYLQQQQASIASIHYGAHNLEELFLQLTHRALRD